MEKLPGETILQILSYVPLSCLAALRALSSPWKQFIDVNENSLYRSTLVFHKTIPHGLSLEEAKAKQVMPWLDHVTDWKGLCNLIPYCLPWALLRILCFCTSLGQKHVKLEEAWLGKGIVGHRIIELKRARHIHRFHVDEEQRTIISTAMAGEYHSYLPHRTHESLCILFQGASG